MTRMKKALFSALAIASLFALSNSTVWAGDSNHSQQSSTHKTVTVHPALGGFILGYDIDQGGTEGSLSEYVALQNGNNNVATEVFDQSTGKITVIAEKKNTPDDYVTEGIFNHIGLVDFQTVVGGFGKNHYLTMNPLGANKFTGKWTPPIKKNYFLEGISNNRDGSDVAVVQFSDIEKIFLYVFSSNISSNTFGPQIPFTDGNIGPYPLVGYDRQKNTAVLVGSNGSPTTPPLFATVDLADGKTREFTGAGVGQVLGLAVDSSTDVAVVTTLGGPFTPPMVDFYDVVKQTGFGMTLPGSDIGGDVEFDSLHNLFIVVGTDPNTGVVSLFEYDSKANLKKTVSGGTLNNLTTCCVLNPSTRTGFGSTGFQAGLESFSY